MCERVIRLAPRVRAVLTAGLTALVVMAAGGALLLLVAAVRGSVVRVRHAEETSRGSVSESAPRSTSPAELPPVPVPRFPHPPFGGWTGSPTAAIRNPEVVVWPRAEAVADVRDDGTIPRGPDAVTIRVKLEFVGELRPTRMRLVHSTRPLRVDRTIEPPTNRTLSDGQFVDGPVRTRWCGWEQIADEWAELDITITCPPGEWWLHVEPRNQRPLMRRFWVGPWSDPTITNRRDVPWQASEYGLDGNTIPPAVASRASLRVHVRPPAGRRAGLEIRQAVLLPAGDDNPQPSGDDAWCFSGMTNSGHYWAYRGGYGGHGGLVNWRQPRHRRCRRVAPVGDHPTAIDIYEVPPGDHLLWLEVAGARHPIQAFRIHLPPRFQTLDVDVEVEPGASVDVRLPQTGLPWTVATRPFAPVAFSGLHPGRMDWQPLRRVVVHGVPDGPFVWRGWARVGNYCTVLESSPVRVNADNPPSLVVLPPVWVTVRARLRWPTAEEIERAANRHMYSAIDPESVRGQPALGIYQPLSRRKSVDRRCQRGQFPALPARARARPSDQRVALAFLSQAGRTIHLDNTAPADRDPARCWQDATVVVPAPGPDGTATVYAGDLRYEVHPRRTP